MNMPYIGITDFMNSDQVWKMRKVYLDNIKPEQKRRLHVGVMMSYKTLHDMPSRFTDAFPKKTDIKSIFTYPDVMNCLHYADYEGVDVHGSLVQAISFGGAGLNALQLDMVWPKCDCISGALEEFGQNIAVILQIGVKAFECVKSDPAELVQRLRDYEGIVNYVLLDKSAGQGLGMDAHGLLPFAAAIREHIPTMSLAVAGGLGPTTMHLVEPLSKEFPDISIDAQGKLRRSGSALDPVDWSMAEEYLVQALRLLV
jgi:hypothetical protein